MNGLNVEFSELDRISGLDDIELCTAEKLMLLKLALDQSHGQPCTVNRDIYLLKKICKSADMILMSVSYNDTLYLFSVFLKIGEIRNNKVNAEHIGLGKRKSAVNNNNVILKFIDRDVLAYLIKSSEKSYLNRLDGLLPALLFSGI